jgi:hypothetical protein
VQPKRFSDFAEEQSPLDGEKIKIEQILNIEIEIIGYRITRSKYEKNKSGKCLQLQMNVDGVHRVLFTGSDVLIEQLQKYGEQIPFTASIKKIDRFYTLS